MKISVYIPSYNQKELLKQAIDSVLNQTLKPCEIIIVDDASTDNSQDLIDQYEKKFPGLIRPFYMTSNQGVARVRIKALSEVQGDYVTYVDGDDLFHPNKLHIEAGLMEQGDYSLVFSNTAYFVRDVYNIIRIWAANKSEMPEPGNMHLRTFLRQFPRNSLFRMELVSYNLLKEVGFHDPNLKISEDYELRIRLTKVAKINYTLLPLAFVRTESHSLSKSNKTLFLSSFDYIVSKHLKEIMNSYSDDKGMIESRMRELRSRFTEDDNVKKPKSNFKLLFSKFNRR
jgi:glycosyltransferase involved in cell wall biosynthesis